VAVGWHLLGPVCTCDNRVQTYMYCYMLLYLLKSSITRLIHADRELQPAVQHVYLL
jgi:hypothetical protein